MTAVKRALILSASLLASLAILPPLWHLPAGIVTWFALRHWVPDVHRASGRPLRWLQAAAVFCLLGALFGPTDTHPAWLGLSIDGALSGVTMAVRAFALVSLASLASSVLPVRRWTEQVRHPVGRRLIQVVVVAANLVPVLLRALTSASSTLRERRPGLLRLPLRLWLLGVHSVVRAALLAEDVALDMAIAAHNGSENTDESA